MAEFSENLKSLEIEMSACEQTPGMSVLQHGELVRKYYRELVASIRSGTPSSLEWRVPDWTSSACLVDRLMDDDIVDLYALYHDCGKPSVLTIDHEGKRHFPDHAAASERVWLEVGGDPQIGRLIGMDMDIHTIKDADVEEFSKRPEAATLMLVGLSEIHANASMFGGIESVSFKMKWKQIDKRGRAVLREWSKLEISNDAFRSSAL